MVARYERIADWVNQFGWTRGAELGVFDGRTHLYLLKHCPNLFLIGVDVWDTPGFKEGATKSGERCFCNHCNETRAARKAMPVPAMKSHVLASIDPKRSTIHIARTIDVAATFPDRHFDFVFVDGDHSTEGVFDDIEAWQPKIRRGGRLLGHDFNMMSVRNAVLNHFPYGAVNAMEDDHLWWVQL